MELSEEEVATVGEGRPVRVTVAGHECVLVRLDVLPFLAAGPIAVGDLVEETMAEYDAGDPLLGSYARYAQG